MDSQELKSGNEPGRYIIIEGPPCVGVMTQAELLARRLRNGAYNVQIITTEPGIDDLEDTAVFIHELKHRGVTILRKRFELAPLIRDFYGEGSNKDYQRINTVLSNTKLVKPDMVIVLDAPADVLHERYQKLHPESSEKYHDIAYLDRLRTGYLWESHQRGYKVIHSIESADKIHEEIWKALSLPEVAAPPKEAPPIVSEPEAIKAVLDTKRKSLEHSKAHSTTAKKTIQHQAAKTVYEKSKETPTYTNSLDYFIPPELSGDSLKHYKSTMDVLLTKRKVLLQKMYDHLLQNSAILKSAQDEAYKNKLHQETERILRPLLPLSFIDGPDKSPLIQTLLQNSYVPQNEEIQKTVDTSLPSTMGVLDEEAKLTYYQPRNEFDLLPALIYPYSTMSLHDIEHEISAWKYEHKLEVYTTAIKQDVPLSVAHTTRYTWDITSDIENILDLKKYLPHADISIQEITARYGFDIPEIVEQADLDESYEEIFDTASALYSSLQTSNANLAPYACLLGHRVRFSLHIGMQDIQKLREILQNSSQQSASLHKLIQTMYGKAAEVHPVYFDKIAN